MVIPFVTSAQTNETVTFVLTASVVIEAIVKHARAAITRQLVAIPRFAINTFRYTQVFHQNQDCMMGCSCITLLLIDKYELIDYYQQHRDHNLYQD